jgi:thymidine kinase
MKNDSFAAAIEFQTVSKMSLELLIGPMFAGKSSAIQSIVRRHESMGWSVFVVTNSMDTRYSDTPAVVNHDKIAIPAVAVKELLPLLTSADYIRARLVVIEEAQFFPDLLEFVRCVVDRDRKHCVVVGLDGDAERRPFGQVLDLVPHCDRVTKLTAMCKRCGDGTPALFTFAAASRAAEANATGVPCVGSDDLYVPLCRKHYLAARFPAEEGRLACSKTAANLLGRI